MKYKSTFVEGKMNKGTGLKLAIALTCAAAAAMTPAFALDGSVTSNGVGGDNKNLKAGEQAVSTKAFNVDNVAGSDSIKTELTSDLPGYNAPSSSGNVSENEVAEWAKEKGVTYTGSSKVETIWNTSVSNIEASGDTATAITINVTPSLNVDNTLVKDNIGSYFKGVDVTVIFHVGNIFGNATAVTWEHYNDAGTVDASGSGTISGGYVSFTTNAGFSSYTISAVAAAPAPTASSESKSVSEAASTNTVQTCQDAGFPAGYYWDESKKACVVDAAAVATKASNGARLVPNTGDR